MTAEGRIQVNQQTKDLDLVFGCQRQWLKGFTNSHVLLLYQHYRSTNQR